MKNLSRQVPFHFLRTEKSRQKKFSQRFSGRQSGQALIVILAFSAILGAGLLSIYNTAQLTTAKRELVNAADASAYSGASIIAQGLNYTAYTNRAILANNALIGQMMAMRSTLSMSEWYWKNTERFWKALAAIAKFIPGLNTFFATGATAASTFADFWGGKIVYPMKVMAEVLQVTGTAAIGLTNHAIWASQQVHLADSLASFEPNMIVIAKENAPDAKVDAMMHATAFGPVVTMGTFAIQFKMKIRKNHRTLDSARPQQNPLVPTESQKDEYLNYLTEVNRNVATPAYLGGRSLIPNAVGLWMATGCDIEINPVSSLSGAFAPAAGMGQEMDTAVRVVDTFASFLGVLANPMMCLFDRHGGSELVQLADGKMAWTSIDVMAFKVPFTPIRVPMAGGAAMSFTEKDKSQKPFPEAVEEFEKYVDSQNSKKYMGHQVALPADCVEYLTPNVDLYAISTNTRTSGTCAVQATGLSDVYVERGLWGGRLRGTARKVVRSKDGDGMSAGIIEELTEPLMTAMNNATLGLETDLDNMAASATNTAPATGLAHSAPPGISGGVNSATTGLPNTAGLTTAGQSFSRSPFMTRSAASLKSIVTSHLQRLDARAFYVDAQGVMHTALNGDQSETGNDGRVSYWTRQLLNFLGLEAVMDIMRMKVSDGVETPRNESMNKVFNVLADGLPPWFWDVRIRDKVQGAKPGEEEDLVFTDSNPDDYNQRRYNLGPLVYLPLIQDMEKIRTTENIGIGGAALGLPDYDDKRNVMRAIGKARIFFRQPSDHWANRYKVVVTSSLLLPYWQVRNESLSYVDKWLLLSLDGLVTAAPEF